MALLHHMPCEALVFSLRKGFRLAIVALLINVHCFAEETKLPRTVLLVTSANSSGKLWYTHAHQFGAMPLEYLGLKVQYCDPVEGLPSLSSDVLGIVLFHFDLKDSNAFFDLVRWLSKAVDEGKKIVIFDSEAFDKWVIFPADFELINTFYKKLGLVVHDRSVDLTYSSKLQLANDPMMGFEAEYPTVLPSYRPVSIFNREATSYLDVLDQSLLFGPFSLISISKAGGYVATNYGFYMGYSGGVEIRKWYINPFEFFRRALGIAAYPAPDVTTLAGRRIFYSHIDGDGWNNFTEIKEWGKDVLSSEVIKEEIIKKNPDLPVTVGIIGADIDWNCHGNEKAIEEAVAILALPQVEVASHTYSHPFFWEFFEDYTPEKEEPFLFLYPDKTFAKKSLWNSFWNWIYAKKKIGYGAAIGSDENYMNSLKNMEALPRAFACHPFDLEEEIRGTAEKINALSPEKKVKLIQWSGDCRVFKKALSLTKEYGIENINGGDSRFDTTFPSYAWIRPLCINQDGLIQPYASMSNENTYTNLWSDKFYAFNELIETLETTSKPIRLRPINLYYHMYSGEKTASLAALKENIYFIRSKPVIAIRTSHFSKLIQDFYRLEMEVVNKEEFTIIDRGRLQTVRFDKAVDKGVDFEKSLGVIGERHFAGSLYIYLDEVESKPKIVLKPIEVSGREPVENEPYLIESSYLVKDLKRGDNVYQFEIEGFGDLLMHWNITKPGLFSVTFNEEGKIEEEMQIMSEGSELMIRHSQMHLGKTRVKVTRI